MEKTSKVTVSYTDLSTILQAIKEYIDTKSGSAGTISSDISNKLSILIGTDSNKSVRSIANEEISKIVNGAPEAYDTLKEIADWIDNHPDATQMKSDIDALIAKVFPLTAAYVTLECNNGVYEMGDTPTPKASFTITRRGTSVADQATVSVSGLDSKYIDSSNTSWEALKIVDNKTTSYTTTITQGGDTIVLNPLTWSFSHYRYYGKIDTIPADTDLPQVITGLEHKALSTTATLGATELAANKYYLFAVAGTPTLKVRDASTGGLISGTTTGIVYIPRKNNTKTDKYTYIIIPASSIAWSFKITNS